MTHRSRMTLGLLLALLLSVTQSAAAKDDAEVVRFYVATDGNDAWSGRRDTAGSGDGPFATVTRARDAIRQLRQKQGGALRQPVTVLLRGGTWFLTEPLVLTSEDSGTEQAPVTWAAYPDEQPILSGGRPLSGWKPVEVEGKTLWSLPAPAPLEEDVAGGFFRQLWAEEGHPRTRARHPDSGYLTIEAVPGEQGAWQEGKRALVFKEGEVQPWTQLTENAAEAVVMSRWVESRLPIAGIDMAQRRMDFATTSVFTILPDDLYYLEGARAFLDQPGEWYLDRADNTVYYLPQPGEDPSTARFIAPALTHVLRLEADPAAGAYVEHVTFRGIEFSHTHWWFPAAEGAMPSGSPQAAIAVPAVVTAVGARRVAFESCRFAHAGTYGLELGGGCRENRVEGCEFVDLGAGGIRIGEQQQRDQEAWHTFSNTVVGNHLHDLGRHFHSAVGIWIGQSYDNTLARNHIHDLYYTGISIGWTWGYGATLARGNLVEGNHVHHVGQRADGDGPILSDMAGIYTLGTQPDTVIRGNTFHDIAARRYGGWGIYFDEGSTNLLAEHNLVYRTTHGGFHQHYGRDNIVRHNLFAFGRDAQVMRSRNEPHRSFTFTHNIILLSEDQVEVLGGTWAGANEGHFLLDSNLYWRIGNLTPEDLRFAGQSLQQWQGLGQDVHSQIADPGLAAPAQDDFTPTPGSLALKLGFRPLDVPD